MRICTHMTVRKAATICLCGALVAAGAALAVAGDRGEIRRLLVEAQQAADRGDTLAAVAALDSVLAADPANPDAPYRLGILRLAAGDTAGAETILAEGVAVAPLSRRLKLLLALVRIETDPESSRKLVDEVLMMRRNDTDALYLRGRLALAEGDSARALAVWGDLLERTAAGGGR